MTLVSIQTVLVNGPMVWLTQNSNNSSKCAKTLVSLGQRYINITRNAIGPKSGQKGNENFNLKGLHRLDINDY